MNVVFVSDDSSESAALKRELTNSAPSIHIDISPNTLDAMIRIGTPGMCEVVVLDTTLSSADAVDLVSFIRDEKRPIGIVALAKADEKEFPADLLNSGIDHFVLKRSGYPAQLPEIFQQLKEKYQAEPAHRRKQVRLLYAGNLDAAQRALSNVPQLKLEPAPIAPDGTWQLSAIGTPSTDAIILDSALTGAQTLKVIKEATQHLPDIPIIVLIDPGDDENVVQAMRAGAADCLSKTGNYFHRLLLILQREIGRREIIRDRAALRSREERLRHIVETLPACVAVIAPDGAFIAVNNAALKFIGAGRLDQIVGRNVTELMPQEDGERILAFLVKVCGGVTASIRVIWKGLDGINLSTDLRAVPMHRDATGSTAALAVLYPNTASQKDQINPTEGERLEEAAKQYEARHREFEERESQLRSQWEAALRDSESRRVAAEQQQEILRSRADDAAARHARLLEEQRAERESWEQVRLELQEQCLKIEGVAQSLRSAQESLLESHGAEQTQWDLQRRQLEKDQNAARQQISELSDALQKERSNLDLLREELGQKNRTAEENRSELERALRSTESTLAQLQEKRSAELSQYQLACRELEQKLQAAEQQKTDLETALRQKDSGEAELIEKHSVDLVQRDAGFQDLNQKHKSAETQITALRSALKETESQLARTAELHNTELSQRDLALKELESKYQLSENQKLSLQNALRDAESSLAQLMERQSNELSQREFAQKKAEQKYQSAEKQRILLEDALHDAQSSLARLAETHNIERAKWESAKQELEEKYRLEEQQHATAMQTAVRETESHIAWISEQNQAKAAQLEKMQQEIEQLKAAHEKLAAASSDFRLRNQRLSRFTSLGVLLATQDGQVLECNDAAARMFGYSGADEALSGTGQNQFRIYAFEGSLAARLQQDKKLENIEWASIGRDGRLVRVQENASLVETPTGDGPFVERILTDISKIHKLGEEVRRARRLESTGDLAAATVKSLKDLCSALAHSSEILVQSSNDRAAVQRIAEALLNDANRGVKHARQFLSVSAKIDRPPALINLNEILTNNSALLHSLIGEEIDLQTVLAPRIGLVSADRNEMTQLIGTLLASSREALPLGGTLTIETSNIEVDGLTSGYPSGLKPGIYVRMVFSADGCALQPERRMGSNRNLVERMGGYLETTNDPKIGNIQIVYLPRVETCTVQEISLSNTSGA